MRQIKFKAFDREDKKIYPVSEMRFSGSWRDINVSVALDNGTYRELFVNQECYLLQFTGITDKDGKEIYEGDVLEENVPEYDAEDKKNIVWVVGFKNGCFGDFYSDPQGEDFECILSGITKDEWKFKIIGNIFENPELSEKLTQ